MATCALLAAAVVPGVAGGPKNPKPAKGPVPEVQLKLAALGIPNLSATFLNAGASMLTVNVLDDGHLLVTFATRQLVPRIPGDPESDEDRIVAGEVVELPTGKVLGQTTWHLHDHGRYLWPLGHGVFALRIGDSMSLMAPLRNLLSGNPFLRIALPHAKGHPLAVQSSPDGAIMALLTEAPLPHSGKRNVVQVGDPGPEDPNAPKPVYALDFFRLHAAEPAGPVDVERAGVLRAHFPVLLPMDADGYLWPVEDQKSRWTVAFHSFGGKTIPAGTIDSSCPPRLRMVSHSQYIALTCRGNEASPKLQAMGLDGHETWEEPFGEFAETPDFQYAPAAGRFAMLRTSTVPVETTAPSGGGFSPSTSNSQEARVYQTESGDLLLKVAVMPSFRVPENFSLSEDGRMLAVVRGDAIEVYRLPEPSKRDMKELAEVERFRPPAADGPVRLDPVQEASAREPEPAAAATAALEAPVSTTTRAEIPTASTTEGNVGDVQPSGPRKRPTLLNPGEKPEFKDKKAPPQ